MRDDESHEAGYVDGRGFCQQWMGPPFMSITKRPKQWSSMTMTFAVYTLFSDKLLVGGLEHFLFSMIYGIILPIDELIFFRGVGIPPARFLFSCCWNGCAIIDQWYGCDRTFAYRRWRIPRAAFYVPIDVDTTSEISWLYNHFVGHKHHSCWWQKTCPKFVYLLKLPFPLLRLSATSRNMSHTFRLILHVAPVVRTCANKFIMFSPFPSISHYSLQTICVKNHFFSHGNLVGSFLSFNFNHKHVMTIPHDGHIHDYVIKLVASSSILRLKVESNFDSVSFFLSYFRQILMTCSRKFRRSFAGCAVGSHGYQPGVDLSFP